MCLVYGSFKDYVSVESLDGDNRYDAGDYGLQVRLSCHSFIILHTHDLCLKYFQFDKLL